jgi:glycosyltransferase involved in cell wall biosynthesis
LEENNPQVREDIRGCCQMRICIIVTGLPPDSVGGTETQTYYLAKHLTKKHDVVVFTTKKRINRKVENRDGFLIRRVESHNLKLKLPLGIRTINILRAIKDEPKKPDIILCMGIGNGFAGIFIKKRYGIPVLTYVRGSDWFINKRNWLRKRVINFVLRNTNLILTQTRSIRRELLNHYPSLKIEVIPNGVELSKEIASGRNILFVGRLHKVKGLEYLFMALKKIKKYPPLLIVGEGQENKELKRISHGSNIQFVGAVSHSDVKKLMLKSKFLVLPSLSEGLPNVILEAMSVGLPVVATKVGGIPDIVEHGETAFLVEPKNPNKLSKYIKILLRDKKLHKKMSKNCLSAVRKYSWETIIKKLEEVMETTVKE